MKLQKENDSANPTSQSAWMSLSNAAPRMLSDIFMRAYILLTFVQSSPRKIFFSSKYSAENIPLSLNALDALNLSQFQLSDLTQNDEHFNEQSEFTYAQLSPFLRDITIVWGDATEPTDAYRSLDFAGGITARFNHIPGSKQLTVDKLLWQHIINMQNRFGKASFHFMPKYFDLLQEQEKVLNEMRVLRKKYEFDELYARDPFIHQRFLLRITPNSTAEVDKQTMGQIVLKLADIERYRKKIGEKALEAKQYIEPVLLEGHKFQVGFFILITSVDPLRIYSYMNPLIKIAVTKYPNRLTATSESTSYNFDPYLSPWDFAPLKKYFVEFPSPQSEGSDAWGIVKNRLRSYGLDVVHMENEIENAIIKTIGSMRNTWRDHIDDLEIQNFGVTHPTGALVDNFFELFKFDFEIDYMGKPWLIQVHSDPTLTPHASITSTDEAMKEYIVTDLLRLLGATSYVEKAYKSFLEIAHDGGHCAAKCRNLDRIWDTACWTCPAWFESRATQKLHATAKEFERRGRYNRIFPSYNNKDSPIVDAVASDTDLLIGRYIKSLAHIYSDHKIRVSESSLYCIYREHCSDHGDCINGKCRCDEEYEGKTCYIMKDLELQQARMISG